MKLFVDVHNTHMLSLQYLDIYVLLLLFILSIAHKHEQKGIYIHQHILLMHKNQRRKQKLIKQ